METSKRVKNKAVQAAIHMDAALEKTLGSMTTETEEERSATLVQYRSENEARAVELRKKHEKHIGETVNKFLDFVFCLTDER